MKHPIVQSEPPVPEPDVQESVLYQIVGGVNAAAYTISGECGPSSLSHCPAELVNEIMWNLILSL